MPPPDPRERPHLHELTFHLQPVVDLATGHIDGLEALVRWPKPDGTVRGPADFLDPILHGDGLDAFTRYGVAALGDLLASHPTAPPLHLNLSPVQLALPSTSRRLRALRPEIRRRLRVELTEQRIPDLSSYAASVTYLAQLGIEVLLDDVRPADLPVRFPRNLRVAGIKLDRSVVEDVLLAPWGASGRAVRRLAEGGMRLTAEGIEDPAVVPNLRALGIALGQGFGLCRPQRDLDAALAPHALARDEARRSRDAGV